MTGMGEYPDMNGPTDLSWKNYAQSEKIYPP